MPLLKRKAFEKSSVSEYLRDDDEVFHCEVTDEIFKDYDEYCERIILVNSMVWTCEMTGKNNLTYAEALESEKAAKKSLRDFPMELRIPILYLAAKTKRSSFAEMSEDVFNYVRERFFVGETVEACLEGDNWCESHILSVTSQKQQPGSNALVPASSYCYEVEQFDESDESATGQIGTAPFDRVRRRKGIYTRDKNRLFLKQFVQRGTNGIVCIMPSALEQYNMANVHFDQIFTGSPPVFASSKKLLKPASSPASSKAPAKPGSASKKAVKKPSPDKKGQTSMDKFVKKTDKSDASPKPKTPSDPAAKKSAQELAEKMRRAEDQMRQRKEEEKAKKKEKNARLQADLKEWQKIKEDQELEDHKPLPKATPIDIEGIPHKHFGDFLSVLEFVYVYADILKTKDVFHNGLDLENFRKALTQKESAGTFSDLIQMFLTTIFSLQEDEAEDYNEKGRIEESTEDKQLHTDASTNSAIELATRASKWSQTYLGTPLSKLPLDPTTVSEVLRLHLLSSGSSAGSRCVTWRYQQRGGYSSADDPALRLRTSRPQPLRRLQQRHVADLATEDKFLVLQCLMNQVLSYATVRDVIEEKLEELKNIKQTLRMLQINERKRENQLPVRRQELKKEAAAKKADQNLKGDAASKVDEELKVSIEELAKEGEEKKKEFEKKVKELQLQIFDYSSFVGSDRAYRRYWFHQRVGGLFVEAGAEPRGDCGPPAPPAPLAQLASTPHERASSDKENESNTNSRGNSPKKPLTNLNGINNKLHNLDVTAQLNELMLCTGNMETCFVHGKSDRPQWCVYHTEEQLTSLIEALNKRGVRESELRHALQLDKDNILDYISKCPLHQLNPNAAPAPPVSNHHVTRTRRFQPSLSVPPDSTLSEALELSLRDHILELEEKIFHGCLGAIKVKDREAWRGTIMLRGYDKQADHLCWGPNKQFRDDYHRPNGVLVLPDDLPAEEKELIPENKYRDPGHYLDIPKINKINGIKPELNGIKIEPVNGVKPELVGVKQEVIGIKEEMDEADPKPEVVRGLASALLQVSQGIHHKYIKRPLGLDEKERKEREARGKPLDLDALERWEVSLMECRSLSQVVLHLFTLDSSVSWSASVLHASCRLCRRKTDPDNMLLCDLCNKGHHLYCLKPKLTKVPEGDWFCEQCRPKERTPRKRRKLFSDEDIEQAMNDSSDSVVLEGVCGLCGSGGRLTAECRECRAAFHPECAEPRPARASRRWTCHNCLNPQRESRRCAAAALFNIHEYTRAINCRQESSDSDESDDNTVLVKLKGSKSRNSKDNSPVTNGSSKKRGRKSKDEANTSRKSKHSLTNGIHEEKKVSKRKSSSRHEVALHSDALETLLRDVMRHKDAWPFYDPVSIEEVPDYLSVISEPMDFSTIKQKLEAKEYATDDQFVSDAALVFVNCYTYNKDTHPVARAGFRLEKYFNKRAAELELPQLPEIILIPDDESSDSNKRRRKSDDQDAPKSKKAKLK